MKLRILSVSRNVLRKTKYTSPYVLPPPLFFLIHFVENMHSIHISGSHLGIINNNDGLDLHSAFLALKVLSTEALIHFAHTHTQR